MFRVLCEVITTMCHLLVCSKRLDYVLNDHRNILPRTFAFVFIFYFSEFVEQIFLEPRVKFWIRVIFKRSLKNPVWRIKDFLSKN